MIRPNLMTVTMFSLTSILQASEVADTKPSEHAQVQALGLSEVKWTTGFWAERFATCRDRSLPAMWDLMKGDKYKPFYLHFLIASGEIEGEHHGAPWNDGDFYKWLEAACSVYAVSQDSKLKKIIDQCVQAIARAQRDDGYIHTPVLIRRRNGDFNAKPFQDRHNFEMYNMGHLITAACLHYRVTGSDNFLSVAKKTADFLDRAFAQPSPELARNSVCPSHYMAMFDLYRTTKEARYLQLAQRFLEMRNLVREGGDDNQDRIPFLQQREAVGHAVRANYLYAGAADLFAETGDRNQWIPLEAIWRNVTTKKMYITGGCGALYDGASPAGSRQQPSIARVHQAYGRNYQLPNTTAHNETCATIGNVLWNWRMFLVTGEARYIDVLELALYNGVLSGVSIQGTDYFYVNPLRHVATLPTQLRWSRSRVPFVTSYCCPPNVLRTISQVNGYAYGKTQDGVIVNLYGGNTLTTKLFGESLRLTQQTDYPWSGHIRIEIDECPEKEFGFKLRIPGWSESARIHINGHPANLAAPAESFVDVRQTWHVGDVVEIQFPLPARLYESHPLVEENRNQVAVKRGPIVFCLESPDLPKGVRVQDALVAADCEFQSRHLPELLGGVTVLQTHLMARSTGDWSSTLYRPFRERDREQVKTRFIPYYAWANRGMSEMTVWLPLATK